jgi:hypothetical protein
LVEYSEGNFIRKIVIPVLANESAGDHVDLSESDIETAIPFGIQWNVELEDITIFASEIELALINNGIWTVEDYKSNPTAVLGAVREAAAPVLTMINSIVKKYGEKT